jgi:hypothetical protein
MMEKAFLNAHNKPPSRDTGGFPACGRQAEASIEQVYVVTTDRIRNNK